MNEEAMVGVLQAEARRICIGAYAVHTLALLLVKSMCSSDPSERMHLLVVIQRLKQFADVMISGLLFDVYVFVFIHVEAFLIV